MDLTLFAKLKEKLITAKKFEEIWTYFFDHFMDNAEFMDMGKPIERHEMLESILGQVAGRLLKVDKAILHIRFVHVPDHRFIHGCGMLNGRLTSVMYFEDEHKGVFNIVLDDGQTQMARFTGQPLLKPKHTPSAN